MFGKLTLAAAAAIASAAPVKLIFDTDMSTDVDDVLALAIALQLDARGEAELLAVVHDTGLPAAAGAISVINHYYGRDDIPIGAYKGSFDNPATTETLDDTGKTVAGPYVENLVKNYTCAPIKDYTQVPEATEVYRRVLAKQPDNSVVIASVGFLINLENLLRSEPDDISPLNGVELVARKVKELALMGGTYPQSKGGAWGDYEWNFAGGCRWGRKNGCPITPEATLFVLENWPTSVPMVFSGFEVGFEVLTGSPLAAGDAKACPAVNSPLRDAFQDYGAWNGQYPSRMSWDPLTTLYAIRGLEDYYRLQAKGHNTMNISDGTNTWVEDEPPKGGNDGDQSYLVLNDGQAENIAKAINEIVCERPLVEVPPCYVV